MNIQILLRQINKRSPRLRLTTRSVSGGGGRLSFSRYGPLDLASPDQSWTFSHGRREECCPRNICSGCYIFDNGDSYPRLDSDVDKVVWLLFRGKLL
jgi:hypothetical protein